MSDTNDATNLLKASCFLTRRPDLTYEEFQHYWTEKHTPMLAKPVEGGPKVYRYVQLYPVRDEMSSLATAPYDGVAEIWFETLEDAVAQFTSEHYKTVVAKDEENFLDRSKTLFLFSHKKQVM